MAASACSAVPACTGHLYPRQGREQPGEAVAEDGMVIDDQDPGHGGHRRMPGKLRGRGDGEAAAPGW